MSLYLGKNNVNICIKNSIWRIVVAFKGILLLSSDKYKLKDSNGIYLIAKEEENYV